MSKPQPPKHVERDRIGSDIEAFLRGGGKINRINRGISGLVSGKPGYVSGHGRKPATPVKPAATAKTGS